MAEAVSDLGVGDQAWIQNINFFVFGGLLLAFAIGFASLMPTVMGNRSARIGAWLIAATGVGVLASGAFPAAPPTEALHFLAGFLLAFGSAIASAVYLGRKLRDTPDWQGYARYPTWTGIGAGVFIAFSFVALNPNSPLEEVGLGGLIERALAVEAFAWHVVTGWKLRRYADHRLLSDNTTHWTSDDGEADATVDVETENQRRWGSQPGASE